MDVRTGFVTQVGMDHEAALDGRVDEFRSLLDARGLSLLVHLVYLPFGGLDLGSPFEHVRDGTVRELTQMQGGSPRLRLSGRQQAATGRVAVNGWLVCRRGQESSAAFVRSRRTSRAVTVGGNGIVTGPVPETVTTSRDCRDRR